MDSTQATSGEWSFNVISIFFLGVLILPLLALWASSLLLVPREDTSPPMAFTYMKIVHPVAFLALTLQLVHLVLEISMQGTLLSLDSKEIPPDELAHRLSYISNRLDALSSTLLDIVDTFLILALFELGNGLLESLTGKTPPFLVAVRYTLLVPSAVVLYFAVATHVRGYSVSSRSFSTEEGSEHEFWKDAERRGVLDTPLLALWWAVSFSLFIYAWFLWTKARENDQVLGATVTFLAATVLNLFNPVRQAVMTTLELELDGKPFFGHYLYAMDGILDYWVRFFIIALMSAVGLPKDEGLWTIMSQSNRAHLDEAMPNNKP